MTIHIINVNIYFNNISINVNNDIKWFYTLFLRKLIFNCLYKINFKFLHLPRDSSLPVNHPFRQRKSVTRI